MLYTQVKPAPIKTGDKKIDKGFEDISRALDQLYKLLGVDDNTLVISGNIKGKKITVSGKTKTKEFSITDIKSGATQADSGVGVGELWKTSGHATLPDNVIMIGI